MHEKGLQRQKGVGPLVSSQKRRAPFFPVICRSSTGHRVPRLGLHRVQYVRGSADTSRTVVFVVLEVDMEGRPLPRPAQPLGCPGFDFTCKFGLHRIQYVRGSANTSRAVAFRSECRNREVMPWAHRSAPPPSLPAPPRPARPRPAPSRRSPPRFAPLLGCPGFGFDRCV